jgi:hypothetical protein
MAGKSLLLGRVYRFLNLPGHLSLRLERQQVRFDPPLVRPAQPPGAGGAIATVPLDVPQTHEQVHHLVTLATAGTHPAFHEGVSAQGLRAALSAAVAEKGSQGC